MSHPSRASERITHARSRVALLPLALLTSLPVPALAVQSPFTAPAASHQPSAAKVTDAALPKAKPATGANTGNRVVAANNSAQLPAR